jgi:hypothetical protein
MSDGERVDVLMMGTGNMSGGSSGRSEREVHRVNHLPIPFRDRFAQVNDSAGTNSMHSVHLRLLCWPDSKLSLEEPILYLERKYAAVNAKTKPIVVG